MTMTDPMQASSLRPHDDAEVRAALARLRLIPDFARSPRLASFLEYVVMEALEGRGEEIRAYTVATAVFGRDRDFDPHSNSIVRVEATRLRKALKTYYAGAGADDRLVIDIPLGAYLPNFSFRPSPVPAMDRAATVLFDAPSAKIASAAPATGAPRRMDYRLMAGVGFGAAIVLAFLLGKSVIDPGQTRISGRADIASLPGAAAEFSALPSISVQSIKVAGHDIEAYALAGRLHHDLAAAIAHFDEVSVHRGFSKSAAPSVHAPDFELQGQIEGGVNGPLEATFRLLHAPDRRTLWSGVFNFSSPDIDAQTRSALVRSIVMPIAQPFGVVLNDLRARVEAGAPVPKSAECIARFEDFWETRVEAKRRSAFECVTGAIQAHPDTVLFQVILSNLYVAEYLGDLPRLGVPDSLGAAEEAAQRAIRTAPGRAHPYLALSQVLNLKHDYEKALRLAERAIEINPNDTDIMAQLGALYILRGKLSQGADLLRHAMDANPSYPAWIRFYLFLEARLRDDKAAQLSALQGVGTTGEPDVAFARVVAAAEANQLEEAKSSLSRLRAQYPAFAAAPKAAMERLTLAPDVAERMVQSVRKAGL